MKVLLGAGVDVNKADTDGWTPLPMAAHGGHGDVVKDLFGAGADENKSGADGGTP